MNISFHLQPPPFPRPARAFTLVELLVVLAIVGILLALLIPAVQALRESAHSTACRNRLQKLVFSCHSCEQVHRRLPPAVGWFPALSPSDGSAGVGPLLFHLLPFLEEKPIHQSARLQTSALDYFDYQKVRHLSVATYLCSCDPSLPVEAAQARAAGHAASSYAANYLVFGSVDGRFQARAAGSDFVPSLARIEDGTANTILFAEKYGQAAITAEENPSGQSRGGGCHWSYWGLADCTAFFALYKRGESDPAAVGPASRFQHRTARDQTNPSLCAMGHRAGMNVALADGSARTLAPGLGQETWWSLVTPAGRD